MWAWQASGVVEVTRNGEAIELSRQSRRLVAGLLVARGQSVEADTLVERLWDHPRQGTINALRVAIARLRVQLGADAPVDCDSTGYRLSADDNVDLWRFEALVEEGSESADSRLVGRLELALSMWRGQPFGDLGSTTWGLPTATHLGELHRNATEHWADASLRLGRHQQILSTLELNAAAEPLREERWAHLMLALYRSGRQGDAVRAFHRARRHLVDELGIEPGPRLQELQVQILRQDPTLRIHHGRVASVPSVACTARANPLIGRQDEHSELLTLLARHRIVTIVGLGGMGKSRLAHHVATTSAGTSVFVELGRVTHADHVPRALAAALGLNTDGSTETVLAATAAALGRATSMVVLDNCEHVADASCRLAQRLLDLRPSIQILLTSRVPLLLPTGASMVLGPLQLGTCAEPGPAACMIAAAAELTDDEVARQWPRITDVCARAGGVPLALELGARQMTVHAPSAVSSVHEIADAVTAAVAEAMADLPMIIGEQLQRLAILPDGSSVEFAAKLLDVDTRDVRYLAESSRQRGLLLVDYSGDQPRLRMLEPLRRAVLSGQGHRAALAASRRLSGVIGQLAMSAIPSWVEPGRREAINTLDDEHLNVVAGLAEKSGRGPIRLEAVARLVVCWKSVGRVVEAEALAARAQSDASTADGVPLAEVLLARALASPSLANRALYVAELEQAHGVAAVLGNRDLHTRIVAELTVARGWRGDFEGAETLLRQLETDAFVQSQPYAASYVRTLRAMSYGMVRHADEACRLLVAEAEWAASAVPDYAMSNLFIAASIVRLNGDDDRAFALLTAASEFELDRFTRQTHARVAYELARIAVSRDTPEAGDRLRVAGRFFETYGDHRSALICRRDLGRWLWRHGEIEEAQCCLQSVTAPLLMIESRAAAPAFAGLAGMASVHALAQAMATAATYYALHGFGLPLSPGEQADVDAVAHLGGNGGIDSTAVINNLISMNLAFSPSLAKPELTTA